MSKNKEKKKVSIIRVQLSVAIRHNVGESVGDIIQDAEFDAKSKSDSSFISIRPLNWSNVLNKMR